MVSSIATDVRARILAASIAWVASFAPTAAHADIASPDTGSDRAAAQALFDDARRLMDAKNYASACEKLRRSQELDPAGGTLLNLAVCHEATGKTATAWREFHQALSEALRQHREERARLARERISAIEPRLRRITIAVARAQSGMEVRLDGHSMPAAAWGTRVPVDPGAHHVEAAAPSFIPWALDFEVEREGDERAIAIPALVPRPAAFARTDTPRSLTASTTSGRRTTGYVAGALGLVALGTGVAFGVNAAVERSASERDCDATACSADAAAASRRAMTSAWISNAGFGVGALGLGLGTFLVLTSPSSSSQRSPQGPLANVRPLFDARTFGLQFQTTL